MTGTSLDGLVAEAVAMLDMGPARKRACHEAALAFRDEFGKAPRGLTVAVGADHAGWCVWACGDAEDDLAGLPGSYRGFPVRTDVMTARPGFARGAAGMTGTTSPDRGDDTEDGR